MRNLHHDARTITCLVACFGSSVLHVLQHLQCVVHQLMALATMNVDHHAHTTSVMLVGLAVQS